MTYPASLLVHSCQIETGETLGTADAFGVKPPTKTYSTVACRFILPKGSMSLTESGWQPVLGVGVIVPAGTAIDAGKKLVGLSTGYTKTYRIKGIPRPAMLKSAISHIVADLEVVG